MAETEKNATSKSDRDTNLDRRDMIGRLGRFAAVTPPAVTFLLSTTMTSGAIAKSGNNGFGNGCCDGVPGNSNKSDTDR